MDARRFWLIFAALAAVSLLPIVVTEIPAYADYPNHLARSRVLAHYHENPFYQELWRPAWAVLPNILTDVLMVGAAKFLPITLAGRLVLGLSLVTVGAGFAALRRQIVGAHDVVGFGGLLLLYGFPVQMGFLNFTLGVGLLLCFLALHIRLREGSTLRYLALMLPAILVLFLCHLMAFVLFGFVVAVWEVAQRDRSQLLVGWGRLVAISALPAVLFVKSPTKGQVQTWEGSSLAMKAKAIPLTFASGDLVADLFFAVAIVMLSAALVSTQARYSRPAVAVLASILILYLAAPFGLGSTKNLDNRIPYVLALVALAMISPRRSGEPERPSRLLAGVVVSSLLIHTVLLTALAVRRGRTTDTLRAQLHTLPPGSLLFNAVDSAQPIWRFSTWNPPLPSAHTIALLDAEIFPSGLFMVEGQHPLLVRSGLEALYWARSGENLDPRAVAAEIEKNLRPLPAPIRNRPRFLMLCGPESPRPGPTLVAAGPRYAIYFLGP